MNSYEQLSSILTAYFCNQFYEDGCAALKRDIRASGAFVNKWRSIVACIQNRELLAGQPLTLVHYQANRALDDNTDEEAYIWLELMIQNVERSTVSTSDGLEVFRPQSDEFVGENTRRLD